MALGLLHPCLRVLSSPGHAAWSTATPPQAQGAAHCRRPAATLCHRTAAHAIGAPPPSRCRLPAIVSQLANQAKAAHPAFLVCAAGLGYTMGFWCLPGRSRLLCGRREAVAPAAAGCSLRAIAGCRSVGLLPRQGRVGEWGIADGGMEPRSRDGAGASIDRRGLMQITGPDT
jgi:hypothetical protein